MPKVSPEKAALYAKINKMVLALPENVAFNIQDPAHAKLGTATARRPAYKKLVAAGYIATTPEDFHGSRGVVYRRTAKKPEATVKAAGG